MDRIHEMPIPIVLEEMQPAPVFITYIRLKQAHTNARRALEHLWEGEYRELWREPPNPIRGLLNHISCHIDYIEKLLHQVEPHIKELKVKEESK